MPSAVFELIEVNRVRFSRGKEAAKMRAAGDEAGAAKATENATILRQMASEHAVAERRQSFRLVHSVPATNRQE